MIGLLASMTVAAQVFLFAVAVAYLVQLASSSKPLDRMTSLVGRDALRLAWLVALVATAGSLYLSEVRHFLPCTLCWYQRIATYPLALILGIAVFRNDLGIWRYTTPLALVGLVISLYHVQLEQFPDQEAVACSATVPCTTIWFEAFGYITIPVMAGTALATIAVLGWMGARHGQGISSET